VSLRVVDVDSGEKPRRSRMLPLAVIGVGGAMVITGGVLIAMHQDKVLGNDLYVHNTKPAGIGFGVAGLAVAAGGVVWFLSSGKKSAPVAAISHDGGYVGWISSF
jgi:hypothetical protein